AAHQASYPNIQCQNPNVAPLALPPAISTPYQPVEEERNTDEIDPDEVENWMNSIDTIWNQYTKELGAQVEQSEKRKEQEWNDWIYNLKDQWKDFNNFVEQKKKRWIHKKEQDWSAWIKQMENKWITYKEKMDTRLRHASQERPMTQSELRNLEDDIKEEVKKRMIKDYKRWVSISEANLYKWIKKDWEKWKKNKLDEWNKKEWKVSEENYWANKDNQLICGDQFYFLKRKKKNAWEERIKREKEQWNALTRKIEEGYIDKPHNEWEEWKNYKSTWYFKWMKYFLQNFVYSKPINPYF
ncbi:tryptophan-rich antigen (Pv-fam-a), partial [Plasmodium malariae]